MDPTITLAELRRELDDIPYDHDDRTDRVKELFSALDEWLSRGGFLPEEWQR